MSSRAPSGARRFEGVVAGKKADSEVSTPDKYSRWRPLVLRPSTENQIAIRVTGDDQGPGPLPPIARILKEYFLPGSRPFTSILEQCT
jgi:hypothetical protein